MDPVVLRAVLEGEAEKIAISWKAPFQFAGSKMTGGRWNLTDEAIKAKNKDKGFFDRFVSGQIDKRVGRSFSDENLAAGLGAAGLGVGAVAAARALRRHRYAANVPALERLGSKINRKPLIQDNAAANLQSGWGVLGGSLGGIGYLLGRDSRSA